MRLDVGGAPHINPSSGEKIIGAHLHLYTEEYGLAEAIPFDIQNKNLYEICFLFFDKFNIIKRPNIINQEELELDYNG